jgi:hypothetical protein
MRSMAEGEKRTEGRHMRAGQPTRRFALVIFATAMIGAAGAADPDPPAEEEQDEEAVVIAEPSVIDLGRVPTGSTFRWTLRLINTGPEAKRVTRIGTPSECGIGRLPGTRGDHIIPPHPPLELEIAQHVGAIPGPIRQEIIALIEDHPPVDVLLRAEAVSFVSIEPGRINPAEVPDGRVKVRSLDGQPFRIARVLPPFMEPTEERSAEHTLVIDWDRWREANRPSSFALETDHPQCPWALGWIGRDPSVKKPPWSQAEVALDPPVFAVPQGFHLGEVPISSEQTVTMYLINTGSESVAAWQLRGKCGKFSYPDGQQMAPNQAIRGEYEFHTSSQAGEARKVVHAALGDQPMPRIEIEMVLIKYVLVEPELIDFHQDPEPCIRVYSVDGQPFRIRTIFPLICEELPEEAATEHFLHLDWQRWSESRHQRRMLITTDHPLCRRLYARLKCGPF